MIPSNNYPKKSLQLPGGRLAGFFYHDVAKITGIKDFGYSLKYDLNQTLGDTKFSNF